MLRGSGHFAAQFARSCTLPTSGPDHLLSFLRHLAPSRLMASDCIHNLLGDTLVSSSGTTEPLHLANNKHVGLYFSASWCPPCRAFTPKLIDFYNKLKSDASRSSELEIVLVSSDRSANDAEEYFSSMPWKMLPYEDRDRKTNLGAQYKVQTIPTLVILDAETGEVVTDAARDAVDADPDGERFPWRPPSLEQLTEGAVFDTAGEASDFDTVTTGKTVALYFSADWCPPCRKFTPQLVEFYNSKKGTSEEFEIIYVSWDRDEQQYQRYRAEMPWWAYARERPANQELAALCKVQSIPTLAIISSAGDLITTQAADLLRADPTGADFPYLPKPIDMLSAVAAPIINAERCIIAFVDASAQGGAADAHAVLQDIAAEEFAKPIAERSARFYVGSSDDEFAQKVMPVFGIEPSDLPLLVVTQLPKFTKEPLSSSSADVRALLDRFIAGKGEMHTLE